MASRPGPTAEFPPGEPPDGVTCTGDQPRAQNAGNRAPAPQERASGPDPDLLGASIGRAPGGRPPSPSRRRRSIRPVINTRRWLANRRLWRPELPLPAVVRWAPATGQHTGAGSIVALPPPPVAWAAAWPELPTVAAVQLVHVDAQGQPALDRPAEAGGREKRAMGMLQGAGAGDTTENGHHLLAQPLSKTISIFPATPVPAAAGAGRRASKRAL